MLIRKPREGTDWQDAIMRNAPMANYQLTFSGAIKRQKYSVAGAYFTQDGIINNLISNAIHCAQIFGQGNK